uniref:Uncharacterized protein n=1 Tax=Glossina palpalis gambiensis TaxID=67801 RepID=A0A1B0BRC9_9MUSC
MKCKEKIALAAASPSTTLSFLSLDAQPPILRFACYSLKMLALRRAQNIRTMNEYFKRGSQKMHKYLLVCVD